MIYDRWSLNVFKNIVFWSKSLLITSLGGMTWNIHGLIRFSIFVRIINSDDKKQQTAYMVILYIVI